MTAGVVVARVVAIAGESNHRGCGRVGELLIGLAIALDRVGKVAVWDVEPLNQRSLLPTGVKYGTGRNVNKIFGDYVIDDVDM
jgi:hypothetical protein